MEEDLDPIFHNLHGFGTDLAPFVSDAVEGNGPNLITQDDRRFFDPLWWIDRHPHRHRLLRLRDWQDRNESGGSMIIDVI